MINRSYFFIFFIFIIFLCSYFFKTNSMPNPKKIPHELIQHNDIRIDNYYWLRDDSRSNKEVLAYLQSENTYANKWFRSKYDHKKEIVNELKEQLPDEEVSFPINNNGYLYYEKFNKDDQLPRFYK